MVGFNEFQVPPVEDDNVNVFGIHNSPPPVIGKTVGFGLIVNGLELYPVPIGVVTSIVPEVAPEGITADIETSLLSV